MASKNENESHRVRGKLALVPYLHICSLSSNLNRTGFFREFSKTAKIAKKVTSMHLGAPPREGGVFCLDSFDSDDFWTVLIRDRQKILGILVSEDQRQNFASKTDFLGHFSTSDSVVS